MPLLERLQYHIRKLYEEQWDYTHTRNGVVEYVEDPKNDNQFRKFIKDSGNYARCAFIKGKWYFWPAKHSTHDDFVRSIGLHPYWNQWHKLEVQMRGNSLELGWQIVRDWEDLVREEIKETGDVSNDTMNIIKAGVTMILDLHRKYGLKISSIDLFKLKKLLVDRKPAGVYAYDNVWGPDRSVDSVKISNKQIRHTEKSLPRKERMSRIGYKWPNNPDKLDLDIDLL